MHVCKHITLRIGFCPQSTTYLVVHLVRVTSGAIDDILATGSFTSINLEHRHYTCRYYECELGTSFFFLNLNLSLFDFECLFGLCSEEEVRDEKSNLRAAACKGGIQICAFCVVSLDWSCT